MRRIMAVAVLALSAQAAQAQTYCRHSFSARGATSVAVAWAVTAAPQREPKDGPLKASTDCSVSLRDRGA